MNRWLSRPGVLGVFAGLAFACILLHQLPASPAASAHFLAATGAPPFDERPGGYAPADVLSGFRGLGAVGLRDYTAYRIVDFAFPWLLCGAVAGVMLRLGAARATMWPWLAALADTAENVALWEMLRARDALPPALVPLASGLTQLKFVLYGIMLAMLLAVGVRHLVRQHRQETLR